MNYRNRLPELPSDNLSAICITDLPCNSWYSVVDIPLFHEKLALK